MFSMDASPPETEKKDGWGEVGRHDEAVSRDMGHEGQGEQDSKHEKHVPW